MRSVTLAPTSKPDGLRPLLEIKGNVPNPRHSGESRNPEGRGTGVWPFKVRANASPIRQTSARLVGRVRLRHQLGA